MSESSRPKEQWASRLGVILAVAGSAVGLGNFLRFPGQAAENGGGAFMIPYFVALLLVGIPIGWAEWTMGREGGRRGFHSAPAIFGSLGGHKAWRFLGAIGVLIPVVVYMYYVVIEARCLGYAFQYLMGGVPLGDDPAQYAAQSSAFFGHFTGIADNGVLFDGTHGTSLTFFLFVFVINVAIIALGVSRGIEKLVIYAMPVMAISALIVLVRVLTLGTPNAELPEQNVINGLGYMWNPRGPDASQPWYASLFVAKTWLAAAGQIFFSLSVGFGVIINYASYMKRKSDVVLSGLTASSTNEFFEVCLGGLITIPAAFIFLGVAGATGGTFGLGFNTLPVVFAYMPFGNVFGFLWFFMLFLAAITSSVSMLQPTLAFIEEATGLRRSISVSVVTLFAGLGSAYILWFSKDLAGLDTLDFWCGTFLIFLLATIQVFLFSWVWGADKGIKAANDGALMPLPRWFGFVIRYVSPTYLLIIFVAFAIQNLPGYLQSLANPVPKLGVGIILASLAFICILVARAGRSWNRREDLHLPAE